MSRNASRLLARLRNLSRNKKLIDLIIRIAIIFAILFVVYFVGARLQKTMKNPHDRIVRMSVFNSGSSGVMALKELLEQSDFEVKKIVEPLVSFDTPTNKTLKSFSRETVFKHTGLILIIEPETTIGIKMADSIRHKAEEGYTVIVFSDNNIKLRDLIFYEEKKGGLFNDKRTKVMEPADSEITTIKLDKHKLFDEIKELHLPGERRFKNWRKDWKPILIDSQGTLIIEKTVGKGKIIVVSDSLFMSNYHLRKKDNGLFAYRLISAYHENGTPLTPIYFDEFHHGYHKRLTMLYFVAKREYSNILLQITLFLILLFYMLGVRFGQYRNRVLPDAERIYYFSEGMASLMSKRQYHNDIFDLIKSNHKKMSMLKGKKRSKDISKQIDVIEKRDNKSRRSIEKLFDICHRNTKTQR